MYARDPHMWFVDSSGAFLRQFKSRFKLWQLWFACGSSTHMCNLTSVKCLERRFDIRIPTSNMSVVELGLSLVTFPREVDDTMRGHVLH